MLWEWGEAVHVYVHIHANTCGNVCVWGGVKYTCMCICDSMVNMYNMHVHVSAHVRSGSARGERAEAFHFRICGDLSLTDFYRITM